MTDSPAAMGALLSSGGVARAVPARAGRLPALTAAGDMNAA